MKRSLLALFLFFSICGFTQTVTPVLYPQFMQGHGTGNAADERRVPYACRMTVSGLTPNTVYWYYNRWALTGEPTVEQGGMTIVDPVTGAFTRVTAPSFGDPSTRGQFTTNGSGSYTGWFISESGIATTHFAPGKQIFFRLVITLQGGDISTAFRVTAAQSVTVLAWENYFEFNGNPTPPDQAFQGKAIRSANNTALFTPKNFLMLYGNTAGTGRPIASTFVESDGVANTAAESYAAFYASATAASGVNGIAGRWGTIIPVQLATGIQNISQYSLASGAVVSSCTEADGIWGTVSTINPQTPFDPDLPAITGLAPQLQIGCTPSGGCNLSLTTTKTDVSCNAGTNGSATVVASGNSGAITYSWNTTPAQTTATATGLGAGTYTVTVTESASCSATATVTITQPSAALSATATSTPTTSGGSTGTTSVTATGGTAPYTYLWSPGGQTTATASALAAGTYTVTVTDSKGCTKTATAIVTAPACNVTVTVAKTDVSCNGGTNGTATVTATGTIGTVSYSWNTTPVQTTATATGLAAGTYTVTVTNGACIATGSVTITQPTVLITTSTASAILCNGGTTTITVTATGSTAPYVGTGTFTRSAGAYSFTVTDARGCTSVASGTVTQPAALVAASTASAILCNGGTASISVTATGGTAPYTGTGTFTRSAGVYSFTVTDARGCTSVTTGTVTQPASLVAGSTTNAILCNGGTATINVTGTGGTAPYVGTGTFTRSAGAYSFTITDARGCTSVTTGTITQPAVLTASSTAPPITTVGGTTTITVTATGGVAPYRGTGTFVRGAGTYTFTATDANNCAATTTISVTEPGCNITSSAVVTNVVCNGANSGSINLTVSGTKAPVVYTWSNGATTEDISGLAAGTYTVTITDANNCTKSSTATVTQPTALVAASSASTILCNGGTANITVTATGGTGPYTGTGTFTRSAGAYSFTVTDARGCTSVTMGAITQPAVLTASSTAPPVTTVGGTTTVSVTAAGGIAPYSGTGAFVRGAGTYTFPITDANNCTTTTTITVTEPGCNITSSVAVTNVACNGGSTGSINLTVAGTKAPVTYAWSNGATTEDINGLTAGTYTVAITDANNCTKSSTAIVLQPTALVAASTANTTICNSGTATITVTATGGTAPYTGTGTFTRSAGAYSFTVTDAKGCVSVTTGTIALPAALVAASTASAIQCNGGSATITVTATGGTAPYTGTGTFTRSAGTYSFTVTDAKGCTSVTTGTITQPVKLIASENHTAITCFGGNSRITINATGGTPPYTGTGSFIQSSGTKSYTVTDAAGCTASVTTAITQPSRLVASTSSDIVRCNDGTATVVIAATGGTAPYTGTGAFKRGRGTWNFTVTDANGCTAVTSITITPQSSFAASSTAGKITCHGGTAIITVNASGGTAPYTGTGTFTRGAGTWSFTVTEASGCSAVTTIIVAQPDSLIASSATGIIACDNATTSVIVTATGGTPPYTGTGTFNSGPGSYSFTVTDANGCTSVTSGTIAASAPFVASATADPITICGGNTIVTVSATGGSTPYIYPGAGNYIREAGTWNFTVTDARGCTAETSITIAHPECLKVYPNPVNDNLVVNHTKAATGANIEIVSINGLRMIVKPVQEGTIRTEVDVRKLAAATYLLVYYNNNEKRTIKFEKIN
jgi:SprB repeat/Secretion system C-terminal sorting domain